MSLVVKEKELKKSKMLLLATCKIEGKEKYVYYDANAEQELNEVKCSKAKPEIILEDKQIYSCFISAPSGAGKSYKANEIIHDLMKKDKNIEDVFLFTLSTSNDPAYEKLFEKDIMKKIDINNPASYQIGIDAFENSICVFDDFDKLNAELKKAMFLRLEQFLTLGRKLKINVITILHETMQYNLTKCIIYESSNIVLFPKASIRTTNQFLTNYMGFDKNEIAQVKKLKTRTIYIRKTSPQYYVADDMIRLL